MIYLQIKSGTSQAKTMNFD